MPKILKPYTIIPPELYVQRAADKQLRNIILDMGRPGYVLVSRQMGKTNLLLNAKRTYETAKDIFVYIDLSNTFPSAKSCFENIINIAIETYTEKFHSISKIIFERRVELKDTPPHKQHTNELQLLLKELNGGKLIIILDEIDALTKTDYSDQIFSQIRSIYFAPRVNYKEFNNLTYLLSGVIEPNEIIKDPKISPFNIGQKIYLNDFSRSEFENFLIQSNLNLNKEIIDRIFYWTNGNPRMTWDVCSDVENTSKHRPITIETIDKIINTLYFTAYDRPPVDNIREIVKHDREIRNSIIEIEFKKGKNISEKIKSKLYLAGIINYDDDDIHIKNEIIRKSLSYDWLRELEEEDKGLIKIAFEEFQKKEYSESLSTFEKYLKDNDFADNEESSLYYGIMGQCALFLNRCDKAIEYFDKVDFDIEDNENSYYEIVYLKGFTYFLLNKYEDSLEYFRRVIENSKKNTTYAQALLSYGIALLKLNKPTQINEATEVFKNIVRTNFTKDKLKEEVINQVKTIAHFNLGQIHSLNKNTSEAVDNFKQAILFGKTITKPKIIFALLKITKDTNEKHDLLNQIIDLIIIEKIKPKEYDLYNPMDFNFDDFRDIAIYAFLNFRESLFIKLEPYLILVNENEKSHSKYLYDLALFSLTKNRDWTTAIKLLNLVYESENKSEIDVDKETKYNALKLLAYYSDGKVSHARRAEYLSMFGKDRFAAIDHIDIALFANTISILIEKKRYKEALKYVNIINSVKDPLPEIILKDYLVIDHFELNLYINLNNRSKVLYKAKEILSLIEDEKLKEQKSKILTEDNLASIKQNAESVYYKIVHNSTPMKVEKKYKRNEIVRVRYKDGATLEAKFKKVEEDIKSGICFILTEASIHEEAETNL